MHCDEGEYVGTVVFPTVVPDRRQMAGDFANQSNVLQAKAALASGRFHSHLQKSIHSSVSKKRHRAITIFGYTNSGYDNHLL